MVVCEFCGEEQKEGFNFCSKCGRQNKQALLTERKNQEKGDENLKFLSYYTLITLATLIAFNFIEDTKLGVIISSIVFVATNLIFAFLQKDVFSLLNLRKIKPVILLGIVAICITSGILVDGFVGWFNINFFGYDFFIMDEFEDFDYPIVVAIISYTIIPAFFEELAFRGFVFNNLLNMRGKWPAIMGSTFLFSLVHFSFYSMLWIFPFGLFLAFLRLRYKVLIYSMVGHFTHNSTVVLIELARLHDFL